MQGATPRLTPIGDRRVLRIWAGTWNVGALEPPPMTAESVATFFPARPSAAGPSSSVADVYVLGLQEAISDNIINAVAAATGAVRVPLSQPPPAGRALPLPGVLARAAELEAASSTSGLPAGMSIDMADHVWGRGDGALLTPKATSIALLVDPTILPYTTLLGVHKHSFGASEGSKGGVGVAVRFFDTTITFVNAHMASKRADQRRLQYSELVERLGRKLGSRGFAMNEAFHHVIWVGDLNFHCKGLGARDALRLISTGRHMELLMQYDELLDDKEKELSFFEYEEPLMAPTFIPTYKKVARRGMVDYASPTWAQDTYITSFKEPFYKGGRVVDRIPSWTDRVQYHSLSDRAGELIPEPLDPSNPELGFHNYHSVNDGLDISDHSPVFATFLLTVYDQAVDERTAGAVAALQALSLTGQLTPSSSPKLGADASASATPSRSKSARGAGLLPPPLPLPSAHDMDFSALPPQVRPLVVQLQISELLVLTGSSGRIPRAASAIFPLPFEDSLQTSERCKMSRHSTWFGFSGEPTAHRVELSVELSALVSQACRLPRLHMLLKVSLDDGRKAQCVLAMHEGGFVSTGKHTAVVSRALTCAGLPLKDAAGNVLYAQFRLSMSASERTKGAATASIPQLPTAAEAGQFASNRRLVPPMPGARGGAVPVQPASAYPGMAAGPATPSRATQPMSAGMGALALPASVQPAAGALAPGASPGAAASTAALAAARMRVAMLAARSQPGATGAPASPARPGAVVGRGAMAPPAASANSTTIIMDDE